MTADPRLVEAVAEALDGPMPTCTHSAGEAALLCSLCDATAAVETLVPLVRAQIAAVEDVLDNEWDKHSRDHQGEEHYCVDIERVRRAIAEATS